MLRYASLPCLASVPQQYDRSHPLCADLPLQHRFEGEAFAYITCLEDRTNAEKQAMYSYEELKSCLCPYRVLEDAFEGGVLSKLELSFLQACLRRKPSLRRSPSELADHEYFKAEDSALAEDIPLR